MLYEKKNGIIGRNIVQKAIDRHVNESKIMKWKGSSWEKLDTELKKLKRP